MKTEPTTQKLRGGYYTPKLIANFLSNWAIQSKEATIFEPSCGDGVFLESAIIRFKELGLSNAEIAKRVHAVEFSKEEAIKAFENVNKNGIQIDSEQIHIGDFFSFSKDNLLEDTFFDDNTKLFDTTIRKRSKFDVILGNPPFIRYQNFPEEHRVVALEIMKRAGLHPNRLTNIWVPFIVTSTLLLKEHGRLAMVVPSELFQVKYAAETRRFLSDNFSKITLINFRKLLFEKVQQEVILFLGEKNGKENTGIRMIELDKMEDLTTYTQDDINHFEFKPSNHSDEKWTKYYLNKNEIELLESLKNNKNLTLTREVIDVDVGVVTGNNDFFILSEEQVNENKLKECLQKIVTRSAHLKGIVFTDDDFEMNIKEGRSTYLFKPDNAPTKELPEYVQNYIKLGESLGINKGYKCKIRQQWYIVPSLWIPDAFMLRQVHGFPKIIINQTNATCTDTIHRVKFINGHDGELVSAAFLNSLTLSFAEITGRSYGGGVLTFEPSESEILPIPLNGADKLNISKINQLIRNDDIDSVLDINDKILLIEGLGLSNSSVKMLRNIWLKLRDRRINRK